MKKLQHYFMVLLAGALGACSSMSVTDPIAEALPADFNVATYLELHPELHMVQIKDYAADYNSQLKASVPDSVYKKSKSDDELLYTADTTKMIAIYTHPLLGGHSAADWTNLFVLKPDTAETDIAKRDSLAIVKRDKAVNSAINELKSTFNLIGVADDISVLLQTPIDEFAVSQQFLVFGKSHGWAYRRCVGAEEASIPRDSLPIVKIQSNKAASYSEFVEDTNLYCSDAAGVVRLIQ